MADKETRVIYRALADFAAVRREAKLTAAELDKLRAKEKAANAESVAGSNAAASARKKSTDSVRDEAKASEDAATSVGKHAEIALRDAAASRKNSEAKRGSAAASAAAGAASRVEAAATDETERAARTLGSTFRRLLTGRTNSTAAARRAAAANKTEATSANALTRALSALDRGASKVEKSLGRIGKEKTQLGGLNVALLVAGIGGLISLLNPVVAGLGAAGAAAIGFGSSLGTLAGSALAAVPALSTLLATVGALKVAFGGIGGAFSAFKQKQASAASGGGGGGGGGGGSSAPKPLELTQTEKITRAQEAYRRSVQDVTFAEEDLNVARRAAIQNLKDLQRQVDENNASLEQSQANAQLALENYANVQADPGSTKGQKMDAQAQVDSSKNDVVDTVAQNQQNVEDLNAAKKKGVEGDRDVIMAERGVTDAVNAQRDAQLALANAYRDTGDAAGGASGGGGGGGGGVDLFQQALDKLSPSARSVVLQLIGMQGAWRKLQQTVQEAFFSKIVDDIKLLKVLFPPVTTLLSTLAGVAGTLADNLLLKVTSPKWVKDIGDFAKISGPLLQAVGTGVLNLVDAFEDLTMAAGPFAVTLGKGFQQATRNFADFVANGRKTGSIADYLDRVNAAMKIWGGIVGNIAKTLVNYGSAAAGFGKDLSEGFLKTTEGWLKASQMAKKAGSPFQKYLEDTKPLLAELKGTLGDFFKWFAKTAADPTNIKAMTDILKLIRDKLGPAIARVLDTLGKDGIGVKFVDALSSIADLIATILDNGGADGIAAFYDIIVRLAKAFDKFLKALPPGVLSALVTGFLTLSVLNFVGLGFLSRLAFSGLFKLLRLAGGAGLKGLLALGKASFKGLAGIAGKLVGGGVAREAAGRAASTVAQDAAGTAAARGTVGALGAPAARRAITGAARNVVPYTEDLSASGGTRLIGSTVRSRGVAPAAGRFARVAGTVGRGAKTLAGGAIGGVASIAGSVAGDYISSKAAKGKKGAGQRVGGQILSGAATGAGIGAAVGSAVPVIGTAVGAVAGGAIGGAAGFFSQPKKDRDEFLKQTGGMFSDFFTKNLPNIVNGAGKGIWDGLQSIGKWFSDKVTDFTTMISNLPQTIATAAGDIWSGIKDFSKWIKDGIGAAGTFLKRLPFTVAYAVGELWGHLINFKDWLVKKWNEAKAWVKTLPTLIAKAAGNVWNNLVGVAKWLIERGNDIKKWAKSLPKQIADAAADIWSKLKSIGPWIAARGRDIANWARGLPRKIADAAGNLWAFFKSIGPWIAARGRDIANWAHGLPRKIGDAAGAVWDGIKSIGAWLKARGDEIVTWASKLPGKIASAVGNLFSGIKASFNAGVEATVKKVNGGVIPTKPSTKGNHTIKSSSGPITASGGGHSTKFAVGGTVAGRGNSDTVPAMLTPGEFVIRRSIVNRIGLENLARVNSGVLTYAQLLQSLTRNSGAQSQNKDKKRKGGTTGMGISYFAGGGLVPSLAGLGGSATVAGATSGLKNQVVPNDYSSHFGDIVIYNPAPEPASDSIPRAVRKAGYFSATVGGKK